MKKIIVILLAIGIIIGAGVLGMKNRNNENLPDIKIDPVTEKPDPTNATFTFEDSEFEAPLEVTLTNGKNLTPLAPGSEINQEIILDTKSAFGDVNNDGKEDKIVLLVQSGGGTGVFTYVAAYVSGPVRYKGSNAVFIGDRIIPTLITISGGVIAVNYLDRQDNEAYAAEPTVSKTKTFVYSEGKIIER